MAVARVAEEEFRPEELSHFSLLQWVEFQRQLAAADVVMKILSAKYQARFLSNIRDEWPSRRIRRRDWFTIREIRLMLNPQFLEDGQCFFELRKVVANRLLPFARVLENQVLSRYSLEQLQDAEKLLQEFEPFIQTL